VLHAPSPYYITCQQQVGFYLFGAVGFSSVRVRIRISVRIMVRFNFSDRVGVELPTWNELNYVKLLFIEYAQCGAHRNKPTVNT